MKTKGRLTQKELRKRIEQQQLRFESLFISKYKIKSRSGIEEVIRSVS